MAENQEDSPPPNVPQAEQEEEQHEVHSFEWHLAKQRPIAVTCNKAGTVVDSLMKSAQFKEVNRRYGDKELVILRDGKAISSHFPCVLLKSKGCLTVRFVKAVDDPKRRSTVPVSCRKKASCDLVTFHVLAKGGKNIVRIMKNPVFQGKHEITVYAYKGENVKQALRRDGRFQNVIFKKNCALSDRITEVTTEMSSLVDEIDDQTFQIIMLNKANPPESQPGSLDDAYVVPNETETRSDSENGNIQITEAELNENMKPEKKLQKISDSRRVLDHLSSQFTYCVKSRKTQSRKLSRVQNLFRVEFGQKEQMCRKVKTMKKLMALSGSVCQVRVNGRPMGTGFLLFSKYILTNFHVIRNAYNEERVKLVENVSAHFSYESIDQTDGGFVVNELVGCDYCPVVSGRDWALLRLSAETMPDGLLKNFGLLPQHGGICIIGHPGDGVKKIDPCLIVPVQNRRHVLDRHYNENKDHVQLITSSFFQTVADFIEQNKALTYESCFFWGSSGSPVFDVDCKVVAMHTGGYTYCGKNGEPESVIEYGQSLTDILENLIVQLVERERWDVLHEYLACSYSQHHIIMDGVKKLVESRNLRTFKEALKGVSEVSLKKFSEFFSLKDEQVPMDLDWIDWS